MLDVAVYLYIAGYHLLDPRDTQYGHEVTCHFLIIPASPIPVKISCHIINAHKNDCKKMSAMEFITVVLFFIHIRKEAARRLAIGKM